EKRTGGKYAKHGNKNLTRTGSSLSVRGGVSTNGPVRDRRCKHCGDTDTILSATDERSIYGCHHVSGSGDREKGAGIPHGPLFGNGPEIRRTYRAGVGIGS